MIAVLDAGIAVINMYEANYPESLRRVFIVNGTFSLSFFPFYYPEPKLASENDASVFDCSAANFYCDVLRGAAAAASGDAG